MATLAAGEKARMYALGKIARGGATRGAYRGAGCFIAIEGSHYAEGRPTPGVGILMESLQISDQLEQVPNTCSFTARGFTPVAGDEIVISIGSKNTLTRLFAGFILRVQQIYLVENPNEIAHVVSCIDYTWALDRRLVVKRYRNQSASAIAIDLLASFTDNFTTAHVVPDLAVVDEISFTNVAVTAALSQLAKRIGGYYYIDYLRDLHFFLTEDALANTPPQALTPAHKSMRGFSPMRDISQWLTRAYQEGGGVNALAEIAPGETLIPVEDAIWYQPTGGVVTSGPQRITYGAAVAGGGGALVGPGVAPSAALALGAVNGGTLPAGTYGYAFTFVTAGGESLQSPIASIAAGAAIGAPGVAPGVAVAAGIGPEPGDYTYGCTFTIAGAGETLLGSFSASVSTRDVSGPTGAVSWVDENLHPVYGGMNAFPAGYRSRYVYTFVTSGGGETAPGPYVEAPWSNQPPNEYGYSYVRMHNITVPSGHPPDAVKCRVYVTPAQADVSSAPYYLLRDVAFGATTAHDGSQPSNTPLPAPTANMRLVLLSAIPIGPSSVTGRNIYRWKTGGDGLFHRVLTIADNSTTSAQDTVLNANVGPAAPTVNTAIFNQVSVGGIAIGPAGVTGRKVYRTAVNGAQLKLLATLANNSATTLPAPDTAADATLGANVPTTDSSGLNLTGGQLNAGSTSVTTSGASAFRAAGGWAILGNGQQVIRYTGIAGNTLTGIPASGIGAIVSTVQNGGSITAAPMLTGIPASGAGAIVERIKEGDPINLLVQVDDLASQQTLAALIGGSGVQESYESDNRISQTEALARANARLALRNQLDVSIHYTARDLNTRSGGTVSCAFSPPTNFTGDFKIQSVQIGGFQYPGVYPTFSVEASASRFSFEDLLRLARTQGT